MIARARLSIPVSFHFGEILHACATAALRALFRILITEREPAETMELRSWLL
jgi:hypothetical protein